MKRALLICLFLLSVTLLFPTDTLAAAPCRELSPGGTCEVGEVFCGACCPSQEVCRARTQKEQTNTAATKLASVCEYITDNAQKANCNTCFKTDKGSWTAIGCISIEPNKFIAKFLGLGIGVAGGVAFLLILFGGFQILTSAGNPEQLNAGRELVSAAVTGLLLIIFSLFLIQLIGYNILGIPGFG